jgi:hypothetical protein
VKVKVIVPSKEIKQCATIFGEHNYSIQIVDEEHLLDARIRETIKNFNPNRYGWCLQQFLKLQASLLSNADFCLILDSDTILLHPRKWVNLQGATLLMPSEEFHQPYFDFLTTLGIAETETATSFVSHHLILDPLTLKSLLDKYLGSDSLAELSDRINQISDREVSSPFCVDYELYAQSTAQTLSGQVFFEKWSNLGISRRYSKGLLRNSILLFFLSFFYSSLSFHSWS